MASVQTPRNLEGGPLVGRDREWEQLERRAVQCCDGRGGLVLISGESGIGKTSLVRAFSQMSERLGACVLLGNAYDLVTTPPYGPWIDLIERYQQGANQPISVPHELKRGTGIGELRNQFELFEMPGRFLREIADVTPVVLILEDIHWCDAASLKLLRYLALQIHDRRILILATYREDEVRHNDHLHRVLPVLVRESNVLQLHLRPFSERDIDTLMQASYQLSPPENDRLVTYLAERCDGNPMYLREVVGALEGNRGLYFAGGRWNLGKLESVSVPEMLVRAIDRRINHIQPGMRPLLEAAAVFGRQIDIQLLQAMSGACDEEVIEFVKDAMDAHLLREGPSSTSVVFSHELLRQALYQRVVPPQRRILHLRVAETMIEQGDVDPDSIAHHLQQAGDSRSVQWLVAAGFSAERTYALQVAAERYQHAIALLDATDSQLGLRGWLNYRAGRQLRFTNPLMGINYLQNAENIAVQVGDEVLAAYARVDRGYFRRISGDLRQAYIDVVIGDQAITRLPGDHYNDDDIRLWVSDYIPTASDEDHADRKFLERLGSFNPRRPFLVTVLAVSGRLREAIELGEPYREQLAALELPDHHILAAYADVCNGLAMAYALLGKPEVARSTFESAFRALEILGRLSHQMVIVYGMLEYAIIPYETEQQGLRAALLEKAETIGNQAHQALLLNSPEQVGDLQTMWLEGDWNEAIRSAPFALRTMFQPLRNNINVSLAQIAHAKGEFETAWSYVYAVLPDGLNTEAGTVELFWGLPALELAASIALDQGDLDAAARWIHTHEAWLDCSGATYGRAAQHLIRAAFHMAHGDLPTAREQARVSVRLARSPRQPLVLMDALRAQGRIDRELGHVRAAKRALLESIQLANDCGTRYKAVCSRHELALVHAVSNELDTARELTKSALSVAYELNAEPLMHYASETLNHLAIPAKNDAGLTPRELDVLRLVAEGLADNEISEQLFISKRTVNTHLTSIYRKLDVNSRTAAAMVAKEHQLV